MRGIVLADWGLAPSPLWERVPVPVFRGGGGHSALNGSESRCEPGRNCRRRDRVDMPRRKACVPKMLRGHAVTGTNGANGAPVFPLLTWAAP